MKNNSMGRLILTNGLPGSGKSTWAVEQINKNPENICRSNRDDIRSTLFGDSYHDKVPDKKSENQVSQVQQQQIKNALGKGKTIIVDDTNLNIRKINILANIAKNYGVVPEFESFDVPVEECKRRNRLRAEQGGRFVPEEVIDGMSKNSYSDGHIKDFVMGSNGFACAVPKRTPGMSLIDDFNEQATKNYPVNGKSVVILDLDGSLFNNANDAYRFLNNPQGKKKDYASFYNNIVNAPVNQQVKTLVNSMRDNDNINVFAVTGRSDDYAAATIKAVEASGAKISKLFMKREQDFRPSSDHKLDVLKKFKKDGLVVVHAIDDREKDIRMFESNGVMVTRVDVPVISLDNIDNVPEPHVNSFYGSGHCMRCGSKLKNGGNLGKICATKI